MLQKRLNLNSNKIICVDKNFTTAPKKIIQLKIFVFEFFAFIKWLSRTKKYPPLPTQLSLSLTPSLPLSLYLSLSLSCGGYKVFAPNATSHFYRRQKIGLNKWNKWFESWWTTSFCPIKLKKDPKKLIFFQFYETLLWGNRPEERVTHRSAASNSNFACPTSHILIWFDLFDRFKIVSLQNNRFQHK